MGRSKEITCPGSSAFASLLSLGQSNWEQFKKGEPVTVKKKSSTHVAGSSSLWNTVKKVRDLLHFILTSMVILSKK